MSRKKKCETALKDSPVISPNIRLRYPDSFEAGAGSIIDDFCYLSTQVRIGRYCHWASGCSIAGGPEGLFVLGDYSSLSSGAKVWTSSDDFVHDPVMIVPEEFGAIKTRDRDGVLRQLEALERNFETEQAASVAVELL